MAKAKEPKLDEEFMFLLPPQTAEERAALRESIIAEGIREPLIVWQEKGILVDGHNRFDVAKELKLNCKYVVKSFKDRNEVIDWMVQNQLGRRNLTDEKKRYFLGKEYLAKKLAHSSLSGQFDHSEDTTAEMLAKKHNVSERTVRRAADYAKGVDASPDRAAILAGKSDKTVQDVMESALHCARCLRLGVPTRNCMACANKQLVAGRKPKAKKKAGSVKFDWAKYKLDLGKIIRAADQIASGYDQKNSDEHKKAVALIGDYVNHMCLWEKTLNKETDDGEAKDPSGR